MWLARSAPLIYSEVIVLRGAGIGNYKFKYNEKKTGVNVWSRAYKETPLNPLNKEIKPMNEYSNTACDWAMALTLPLLHETANTYTITIQLRYI